MAVMPHNFAHDDAFIKTKHFTNNNRKGALWLAAWLSLDHSETIRNI